MANEWTYLRGPKLDVMCPTETTITRGTPCYISSNLLVASGDGNSVDVVCGKDCVSGDFVPCELPLGAVYLAKAAVGTDFAFGDQVFMAATSTVDAGSAGNCSTMHVINYNPASGGCLDISVMSALCAPKIHA